MSQLQPDTRPRRRFTMEIEVGGDTRQDMLNRLRKIWHTVQAGEDIYHDGDSVSTGHMILRERPQMTHERYMQDLERHAVEEAIRGR